MRLRKYAPPPPPTITLKQHSANKLVELYHEMINVANGKIEFNQNECELCVIGNGLRAGLFNIRLDKNDRWGDNNEFGLAINSIKLPETSYTHDGEDDFAEAVSEFLFGGTTDIACAGEFLRLHCGRQRQFPTEWMDELDACVRIAGVLDRAGYDVSELPSLPRR